MKKAFTLVELIVVITVLAILATIAFLSFQNYTNDARDVIRTNDVGLMKTSLELFQQSIGHYPIPDNPINITYSGGLLWQQGVFGNKVFRQLSDLSTKLIDPLYLIEYPYSVNNKKDKYQLSTVIKGDLASINIISKVNAIDNGYYYNYIVGNYNGFSLNAISASNECYLITVPDININNIPVGNDLIDNGSYNFVYNDGYNLPSQYLSKVSTSGEQKSFNIKEAYKGCSMVNLSQLNNYIKSLANSFMQFKEISKYEELIYDNDTKKFIINIIKSLNKLGINTNDLLAQIKENTFFNDDFTGNDNTILKEYNSPDGEWLGAGTGSYEILGNKLKKLDGSDALIFPEPIIPLTIPDTRVLFTIKDFGEGVINVFVRYDKDGDNYYRLELSSTGYKIFSVISGESTEFIGNSYTIDIDKIIEYSVIGDEHHLIIGGYDLGTYVDTTISGLGSNGIELKGTGAIIDDYTLIYK